jgi:solute carrier family 39 (zinc transporter), member 1/2/3
VLGRPPAGSFARCSWSLVLFSHHQAASAHGGIGHGHDDEHSSSSPAAPSRKALIAVKVWCLVILLVLTFLGGMSPYFRWNEAFLVLGTQFAAGVFLGTSLMHFLADSANTLGALVPRNNHYPLSYMLTCVGFLATMLADFVVVAVWPREAAVKAIGRRRGRRRSAAAEKGGRPPPAAQPDHARE